MSNESPQRADGPPLGPTTGSALDLRDLTYDQLWTEDDEYWASVDDRPDDDQWGCCYPEYCCMPGAHLKSECHTAEMLEEQMREADDGKAQNVELSDRRPGGSLK